MSALPEDRRKEYSCYTVCTNCGDRDWHSIKYGTAVSTLRCPNCGLCRTLKAEPEREVNQ